MKAAAFLLLTLVISLTIRACLPKSAKELAISTLCEFPDQEERNTCQRVEIVKVVEYKAGEGGDSVDVRPMVCIEMQFVDFTGEKGVAVVWLAGSSQKALYEVVAGPLFESHCQ